MVEISIVTRTLNRSACLQRAANGLSAQTFKAFEWVIVNDGGSPIDSKISDPARLGSDYGVNIITHKRSQGRSKAAIAGINAAKGRTIMLHDDDDALSASALEKLYAALTSSDNYAASTCGHELVSETMSDGTLVATGKKTTVEMNTLPLLQDLAQGNFIPTIGTLFRKDLYEKVGGISATFNVLEDWDLWLRLMLEGDFAPVDEILARAYIRDGDTSGLSPQSDKADHKRTLRAIKNHYLRADIKSGKSGLGYLLNDPHSETFDEMTQLLKALHSVKRVFTLGKSKSE